MLIGGGMIPWYYKLGALLLAVTVIYATGYMNGMHDEQHEWEIAVSKQRENNLKINAEVSNDYQKKIADIRKRYDALRLSKSSVRNTNSASGFDAAACPDRFHGELSETLRLMMEADLNTQQLIALQEWVKSVK